MGKKVGFRFISVFLACMVAMQGIYWAGAEEISSDDPIEVVVSDEDTSSSSSDVPSYEVYLAKYEGAANAKDSVTIDAASGNGEGVSVTENKTLLTAAEGYAEWTFTVPTTGFYNMQVKYFPTISKGGSIERTVKIDGEIPFKEVTYVSFSRIYKDDVIVKDGNDNDLRPAQIESPRWLEQVIRDPSEYVREDLRFYLSAGEHTLRLESVKSELELQTISFIPVTTVTDYAGYTAENSGRPDNAKEEEVQRIEAETPLEKSSFTIYPLFDKASASTFPQHPIKVRLNTIGGDKWQQAGQWLSWNIHIDKAGYYKIAPRFRQNAYAGGYVTRRVLVDGKILFSEMENVRFPYADNWAVKALGDEEQDYVFYLDEGDHTIRMEVTLGDIAATIATVEEILESLNQDYRRILMLTGPTPDIYRDYSFTNVMPDVLEDIEVQTKALKDTVTKLQEDAGTKGDYTAVLTKTIVILEKINKDADSIPKLFQNFKENLSAIGTWLLSVRQQPLEFDSIYVIPAEQPLPKSEDGIFDNLLFQIKAFFLSFFEDYQTMSYGITQEDIDNNNVVKVWIATGRDQSQILQQMTEQSFTPQTGIKVELQLVAVGSLLPAVLAGIGPDVSLSNGSGDPINFAIRNAVVDLTEFPDLEEVKTRFSESAMVPYEFMGHTYALPETLSFLMMFYRTDIFEELKIEPPETWDDFYAIIPTLQKNHLDIGFPVNTKPGVVSNANLLGMQVFAYQNGASLYNADLTATALSEDVNIDAFKRMTELFTLYKFPADYDFANRFRSGEMPLGIQDYTLYNQLTVFAPEIKGLWKMVPLPGLTREDGTFSNTSPCNGTAVMMLRSAKNRKASWEFMKWWTSAETQSKYALEMESVMGPAAKQPTANMEALANMTWTAEEYRNLSKQMENLTGTPEVPGGYYIARAVDFAFSSTYTKSENPVTALQDNVKAADDEIARKRHEFGLD